MRRRLLDHTYKKTVTGNPAVAKSVARMYPDISFPGFTTQDGTPSPENPVDIVNAQSPVQVEISDGGENIQTVTITSDRPITQWDKLVKQNGVWGWLYKSKEAEFDGSGDEAINYYSGTKEEIYTYYIVLNEKSYGESNLVCNKFLVKKSAWNVDEPYIISGHNSVKYIYFNVLKADIADNTAKSIKTWLQSNPIKVLYETENTEFVPLPQEEQEALNTLHTNNPTTIVQNSIGTDVTLTYKTKRSLEVTQ